MGDVCPEVVTGDVCPEVVTGDVCPDVVTGDVCPDVVTGDVCPEVEIFRGHKQGAYYTVERRPFTMISFCAKVRRPCHNFINKLRIALYK